MKIEKGCPAPTDQKGGRKIKHPFTIMDIGDSVLYPDTDENGRSPKHYIDIAHNTGIRQGKKFVSRKQSCGGVRIWRTE